SAVNSAVVEEEETYLLCRDRTTHQPQRVRHECMWVGFESDTVACRPSAQFGSHIPRFGRNGHWRGVSGRLEDRAEQDRGVDDSCGIALRETLKLKAGEIAKGTAVVEKKLHFLVHLRLHFRTMKRRRRTVFATVLLGISSRVPLARSRKLRILSPFAIASFEM